MAVKIQPLNGYVVAQAEEAQTKTASGLYLTESSQEKPMTAKIVNVSKDTKDLKAGDRIIYKSYTSTEVKFGAEKYLLIKDEDVLATVK